MRVAYVDTSCLVAIVFGERGSSAAARLLERYDILASSNLTEAELASALVREHVPDPGDLLRDVAWVLPDRPLTAEIRRALAARYLRGADLWHVATALYLAEDPREVDFLTLDAAQRDAAAALGFAVPLRPAA